MTEAFVLGGVRTTVRRYDGPKNFSRAQFVDSRYIEVFTMTRGS